MTPDNPPIVPLGMLRGVIRDALCLVMPCPDGAWPGTACPSCQTDAVMRALTRALGGDQ